MLSTKTLRITLLLWVFIFSHSALASSYKQLTIEETVQGSELIFEGLVVNVEYKIPSDRENIYTYVTFKINDLIKGSYPKTTIELRYPGGEINGIVEKISDMVIPKTGEQGIFFVKSLSEHFVHPLTGWAQGQILILNDAQGTPRIYTVSGTPIQQISSSLNAKKINLSPSSTAEVALGVATGDTKVPGLTVNAAKQQLLQLIKE